LADSHDLICPLLTSAPRSGRLSTASVAEATRSRSPGVSSAAFCAQPPDLRFAPLMDTDFAVSCPLVRRWRLVSGSCPSTRTFDPCFFQTPPRGGGPCILTRPSPPSGWPEDSHLQAAEHAQHTTKPLARRTLRVAYSYAMAGFDITLRLFSKRLTVKKERRKHHSNTHSLPHPPQAPAAS